MIKYKPKYDISYTEYDLREYSVYVTREEKNRYVLKLSTRFMELDFDGDKEELGLLLTPEYPNFTFNKKIIEQISNIEIGYVLQKYYGVPDNYSSFFNRGELHEIPHPPKLIIKESRKA